MDYNNYKEAYLSQCNILTEEDIDGVADLFPGLDIDFYEIEDLWDIESYDELIKEVINYIIDGSLDIEEINEDNKTVILSPLFYYNPPIEEFNNILEKLKEYGWTCPKENVDQIIEDIKYYAE